MLLLENNVDGYKKMVDLKMNLTRKEARPKYTKDAHVNEKAKGWSRNDIKRYNTLIKIVRLGRIIEVSKEMEIELKLKYARICRDGGGKNGLDVYSDSDDSDSEDLEAYNGLAGNFTVINIERTEAV